MAKKAVADVVMEAKATVPANAVMAKTAMKEVVVAKAVMVEAMAKKEDTKAMVTKAMVTKAMVKEAEAKEPEANQAVPEATVVMGTSTDRWIPACVHPASDRGVSERPVRARYSREEAHGARHVGRATCTATHDPTRQAQA